MYDYNFISIEVSPSTINYDSPNYRGESLRLFTDILPNRLEKDINKVLKGIKNVYGAESAEKISEIITNDFRLMNEEVTKYSQNALTDLAMLKDKMFDSSNS